MEPPTSGDVVAATPILAPDGAAAWRIEYVSRNIAEEPITVTGWVAAPTGPIPPAGRPVIAYGHPTAGLGDECAPTRTGSPNPFHFAKELAAGWVVAMTDYEGLGTAGLHPYLVSESEARSVLHIVLAARAMGDDLGAGDSVALWGFSQGGHAVLAAADAVATLAPELDLVGVVAVAPAVELDTWPAEALGTSAQGYIAAIVLAYADAYHLDIGAILTPEGLELVDEMKTSCAPPTTWEVALRPTGDVFRSDPGLTDPWSGLLAVNSPRSVPPGVPVLLVLGERDELFRPELLGDYVGTLCQAGADVATSVYPGEGHTSVNGVARDDIHAFLADRISAAPFTSEC